MVSGDFFSRVSVKHPREGYSRQPSQIDHLRSSPFFHGKASRGPNLLSTTEHAISSGASPPPPCPCTHPRRTLCLSLYVLARRLPGLSIRANPSKGNRTVPKTYYRFCRTYSICLSSWDPAPRAFPRTVAHAYPYSGKVKNNAQVYTFLRTLSGLSLFTSIGKGSDQEGTPHEAEDSDDRANYSTSTQASPLRSSDTSGQIGPSPSTTCNNKPRGKTHPTSRAPILQGVPSTGATRHGRERRSHKASTTDHVNNEDRGILVQHSRRGNLGHLHS
ncbi:hypothetical protein CRG98_017875 [Punica granatum]|uniref:Uncharacterized protein n=1 Tax=Punica granatum TaxID=22663 RepID=A0A2I0JZI3_PUNGR|nr:hypothetical protein CRG98_017875 [Punica granatum]